MGASRDKQEPDYRAAVKAALQGDPEGFRILYEATYRDRYYIAYKYMKNSEDAADILQEAYLKAWKHLSELKEPERFAGWFSVIVANCAMNAMRSKKPMLFSEMESDDDDSGDPPYGEEDLRAEYQPEQAFDQKEVSHILSEMIDALSDEQRICILMYYVEERSVAEIADICGCSRNTILSRLAYGRKNLKKIAARLGYEA